jgi:two-component system, OmpR family, alkaline phosphatase synthesis response regulator PhoP
MTNQTILIAEDDPNILDGVCALLHNEGFTTIAAPNGQIALDLYKQHNPDFIILDIMMPQKNGYDVCKEVRKINERVPILFLSAKSEEIDKVVGLELGADDFLSKPFGTRELLARVRSILRRVQAPNAETANNTVNDKQPTMGYSPISAAGATYPPSFCMQHLTVYPRELRIKHSGITQDISNKDLSLLWLFYQNPNIVLDRNDLFNAGWGNDYIGSTRTLDQHISQLRKKIESNPAQPKIICTVHGSGYRYTP